MYLKSFSSKKILCVNKKDFKSWIKICISWEKWSKSPKKIILLKSGYTGANNNSQSNKNAAKKYGYAIIQIIIGLEPNVQTIIILR